MALQLIVRTQELAAMEAALGRETISWCEVFQVDGAHTGISIPTKVLDTQGEEQVASQLAGVRHFDLWAGEWKEPASGS